MVAQIGVNKTLEKSRMPPHASNFMPYGISGVMVGAALVFFAFIGFDSISTHSEEAIKPQRDVPIGIIASLGLCTLLYPSAARRHPSRAWCHCIPRIDVQRARLRRRVRRDRGDKDK